jgi:hypothetical protein
MNGKKAIKEDNLLVMFFMWYNNLTGCSPFKEALCGEIGGKKTTLKENTKS